MSSSSKSALANTLVVYNNEGARQIEAGNYASAVSSLSAALEKSKDALFCPAVDDGDQEIDDDGAMTMSNFSQVLYFRLSAQESDDTCYKSPIFFTTPRDGDPVWESEEINLVFSAVIIFNIAQANYLQSLQESNPGKAMKILIKSAKLYEYGVKVMCEVGEGSSMYFMCAWNNLMHIYQHLGNRTKSNELSLQLLRMAMYLSQVDRQTPNPLIQFFLGNTMSSLFSINERPTAPAA